MYATCHNPTMSDEQAIAIRTLVFASGFSTLALEILGIRILAPYVGTTAPVWTALIGVTLAGSAVGYYVGGTLADRVHGKRPLLWIAMGASVSIALIPSIRDAIVLVAQHAPYGIVALVSSICLFFAPTAFLSALITYSIRVSLGSVSTLARVNGNLYALATIGSFVGVFSTGYVLIPLFTVPSIVYGLSAVLFVCAIAASFPSVATWIIRGPKTSAN